MKTESKQAIIEGAKKSAQIQKDRSDKLRLEYQENPKKCENCGTGIPYEKRRNRFCSRSCSTAYNNAGKVRNGYEIEKKRCLCCGKEFKGKHTSLYCSKDCQHKYEWDAYKKEIKESNNGNPRNVRHMMRVAKRYLFEERGHQCECCGITEWMGQPAPLVLDHIDGNPENHCLDNLRLVCGNCDMQLPTYKSKNIGNGRATRRQRYKEGKSY